MRHPDHQATGRIFRDAVTLARIAKVVAPLEPLRSPVPIFTLRDVHSPLPAVALDVGPYLDGIEELARFYLRGVGFGDPDWLRERLRARGRPWSVTYAEEFDAWETEADRLVKTLLPAPGLPSVTHPTREALTRMPAEE
jgi:LmbE family N-acetylglucosaminyl deacetylase